MKSPTENNSLDKAVEDINLNGLRESLKLGEYSGLFNLFVF
jgi:hypothetical protein